MSGADNGTKNRAGPVSFGGLPRFSSTGEKGGHDMEKNTDPGPGTGQIPSDDKADAYSRPNARFDEDGQLEIRASGSGNCRRALWYTATGHRPSTTPTEDSLTVMEAGNALEPVVLRAMERAGWEVTPADPHDPKPVSVQLAPKPEGDGPPRRHGGHAPVRRRGGHRGQDQGAWGLQALADPGGGAQPPRLGGAGRRLHLRDLWRGPATR